MDNFLLSDLYKQLDSLKANERDVDACIVHPTLGVSTHPHPTQGGRAKRTLLHSRAPRCVQSLSVGNQIRL